MKKVLLMLLCCVLAGASSIAQPSKKNPTPKKKMVEPAVEKEPIPFDFLEEKPLFMGCTDIKEFEKFIYSNIVYPIVPLENGIEGKVVVSFTVKEDGSVDNVKVLKGVDSWLDKEAMRVVKSSPKWVPAKQNGRACSYDYAVSIKYAILR